MLSNLRRVCGIHVDVGVCGWVGVCVVVGQGVRDWRDSVCGAIFIVVSCQT